MALGHALSAMGSFFEGWKTVQDIIQTHDKMLATAQKIEGYRAGKEIADTNERNMEDLRKSPYFATGEGDLPTGSTGSSTPPSGEPPPLKSGGSIISPQDAYRHAINAGFDPEGAKMITAISGPESSYDPFAHGDKNLPPKKRNSWGITQINEGAHGPVAREAYGNPARAMELAFKVSKGGTDWTPWTAYNTGAYKKYLNFALPDVSKPPTPSALGYGEELSSGPPVAVAAPAAVPVAAAPAAASTMPNPSGLPLLPSRATMGPDGIPRLPADATREEYDAVYDYIAAKARTPRTAGSGGGADLTGMTAADAGGGGDNRVPPLTYQRTAPFTSYQNTVPRGGTPAMPGPGAGGNPYNTQLSPTQEASFRAWVKNNKVKFNPDADMSDYDMRGFWRAQQDGDERAQTQYNPDANEVHYPDIWKTPIHKTFSNESQYAPPGAPRWVGGRLISQDGSVLFDGSALGR